MIVVTGGAGFIGSNLVAALEQRGIHDIVVVDRLGTGDKWRNLRKRELAEVIGPDALLAFLDANAAEIEVVFHLGAISSTTEPDADLIVQTNFTTSNRLWDWCSWRGCRLIYASSAATYGDGAEGFGDGWSPAALARLKPLNAYGWSKHLFDRRVSRLVTRSAARPPQWAGLKFFNVYGPNEYHKGEQMSVAAHLFPVVREGKPAQLFRAWVPGMEDGGQRRDFVWVGDCVAVMLWLLDTPDANGLFNVGTGEARSFNELAAALFAAAGRPARIEYFEPPEAVRRGYQHFTQADLSGLRAAGYDRPFLPIEQGVARYVRDHLAAADPFA